MSNFRILPHSLITLST